MNYLIYGTSYQLIEAEIKKIINGRPYQSISLSDVDVKEVLEDLSYDSMFDEDKILVLKEFETLVDKKESAGLLEELINYLKVPNKSTTLIFVSSAKINEKSKKNKEFLALVNVIETPVASKPYEVAKILEGIIKSAGFGISQNAINEFSTKCASSIDVAIMEFNKLKIIKGNNKLITQQDIDEYVSNYNTSDIFDFKDAVINKNIEKANNILNDLETSKIEIVPLVVMLAKEYEVLYNIKALVLKNLSNDQISKKLDNMHPYRVKLLKETSNKYALEELQKHLLYLCNLDLKLVSQDNLGFDEIRKFLLEL